jgi:hypothetical protein
MNRAKAVECGFAAASGKNATGTSAEKAKSIHRGVLTATCSSSTLLIKMSTFAG